MWYVDINSVYYDVSEIVLKCQMEVMIRNMRPHIPALSSP